MTANKGVVYVHFAMVVHRTEMNEQIACFIAKETVVEHKISLVNEPTDVVSNCGILCNVIEA